jgi:peptidoglycan/LPS O-acetylase OafA/YrhL
MFLTFLGYFLFYFIRGRRPNTPPSLSIIIISALFFVAMPFNALSPYFDFPTNNLARFITGILFGFSVPLFLLPAFNYSFKNKNTENIIRWGGYLSLLLVVGLMILTVVVTNSQLLFLMGYASIGGLIIFVTLLNATIVKSLFEYRQKVLNNYWSIGVGLGLAVIELSLFHLARLQIEQLLLN